MWQLETVCDDNICPCYFVIKSYYCLIEYNAVSCQWDEVTFDRELGFAASLASTQTIQQLHASATV